MCARYEVFVIKPVARKTSTNNNTSDDNGRARNQDYLCSLEGLPGVFPRTKMAIVCIWSSNCWSNFLQTKTFCQ